MGKDIVTFETADMEFRIHAQNIPDFFRSEAVGAMLDGAARRIAAAANAASSEDDMDNPPFDGRAVTLDRTCIGVVATATPHGFNAKERIIENLEAGAL